MKTPNVSMNWTLVLILSATLGRLASAQPLPSSCFDNQSDYSYMWWEDTIKEGNATFAIETNHYNLSFHYPSLSIEILAGTDSWKLKFGTENDGSINWCETTSGDTEDCQLVETGKYFQRRFINNLPDLKGFKPYDSGLEISSWPDRLSFILKATPESDLRNAGLHMRLEFPAQYSALLEKDGIKALMDPSNGSGFIVLKSTEATELLIENTAAHIGLTVPGHWASGQEMNTGIILYPVEGDIQTKLAEITEQETRPLRVTAKQVAPEKHSLKVEYDQDYGWHQVRLRSDAITSDAPVADTSESNPTLRSYPLNDRIERVQLAIENPSTFDRVIRFNFAKGRLAADSGKVFAATGISAVFRDRDGAPVGIPIQLSKNWHGGGRKGIIQYFRGSWFHGLSMLTIPANSTINIEYTSVNSLWGGVPAASHAQLSLVGWGGNQQWDESAIGAWGESITYEPDLDQAGAPVLDFRPLMVRSETGRPWGWTGNMGGADFFNATRPDGTRAWHSRIRTRYKRYSPNFTEVTYTGVIDDGAMDFEYTASVGRSDDLTRGIYKIKLRVNEDATFKDFVVFQAGAATYHYVKSNTLAWGDESGLKQEWQAAIGPGDHYVTDKVVLPGRLPWFSFSNSEFSPPRQKFLPANRGFVIREWNATISGKKDTPPWFAEFNATAGHGDSSGLINITLPDGCASLKTGDSIEAEIVMFIIPASAKDYYGPNDNFRRALLKNANSWKMAYREAVGNDLGVDVSKGELIDSYPIKVQAEEDRAQFSITGGLGYVPLTITNVSNYKSPKLYRKTGGLWARVDQSVHGKDYWQSEYNASSGTWDITYNVTLDSPGDRRSTVDFKFIGK